jgi:hypothetical protein
MAVMALTEVPASEVIILETNYQGKAFVTNVVTHARHELPNCVGREWILGYDDEDGSAFVCTDGDDDPVWADDLMKTMGARMPPASCTSLPRALPTNRRRCRL